MIDDAIAPMSGSVRAVVCGGAWFVNDELLVQPPIGNFFTATALDALRVDRIALAGHLVMPNPRAPGLLRSRPLLRVRLDPGDGSGPLPGIAVPCPGFLDELGVQACAAPPAPDGTIRFYVKFHDVVVPRPARYTFVLDLDGGPSCRVPFEVGA